MFLRTVFITLVSAASWVQGAKAQNDSTLVLVDGPPVRGSLVEILASGAVVLQSRTGTNQFDGKRILRWGEFIEPADGPVVLCTGGSLIRGELEQLKNSGAVRWRSAVFPSTDFERSAARGLMVRMVPNRLERDRLAQKLLTIKPKSDIMWLRNGDQLDGQVTSSVRDAQNGSAEVDRFEIRLASGSRVPAMFADVLAVAFKSAVSTHQSGSPKFAILGLRDGSRLLVDRIAKQETRIQLELNDATILEAEAEILWPAVCAILVFGDQVTYVSDLPSLDYRHIPFLTTAWPLGIDHAAAGGLLRQGGRLYLKGLGMHSNSRCAFTLDGKFRRFESELAIDDQSQGLGSAVFRVYSEPRAAASGSSTWQLVYESPVVRGGDPRLPISVNVAGAMRLALVVDMADRGDEGDHANWLNARLIPEGSSGVKP